MRDSISRLQSPIRLSNGGTSSWQEGASFIFFHGIPAHMTYNPTNYGVKDNLGDFDLKAWSRCLLFIRYWGVHPYPLLPCSGMLLHLALSTLSHDSNPEIVDDPKVSSRSEICQTAISSWELRGIFDKFWAQKFRFSVDFSARIMSSFGFSESKFFEMCS